MSIKHSRSIRLANSNTEVTVKIPAGHLQLNWESTEGHIGCIVLPVESAAKMARTVLRQAHEFDPLAYASLESLQSEIARLRSELEFAETGE